SFIYPEVCQICEKEQAGPDEGFICAKCHAGTGHVRWIKSPYCEKCGIPFSGDIRSDFTCDNCGSLDLSFDSARAAVVATPFLLDVIHRYKYRNAPWFER